MNQILGLYQIKEESDFYFKVKGIITEPGADYENRIWNNIHIVKENYDVNKSDELSNSSVILVTFILFFILDFIWFLSEVMIYFALFVSPDYVACIALLKRKQQTFPYTNVGF